MESEYQLTGHPVFDNLLGHYNSIELTPKTFMPIQTLVLHRLKQLPQGPVISLTTKIMLYSLIFFIVWSSQFKSVQQRRNVMQGNHMEHTGYVCGLNQQNITQA